MAKSPTLYPDPEIEETKERKTIPSLRANVQKSSEALSCIIIASLLADEPWKTDTLIRTCALRAFNNRYSGNWKVVQELLETTISGPAELVRELSKYFSPEDIFGNLIPNAIRFFNFIQIKNLSDPSTGKVRKPQFRRGYKDKGSRRLAHERHGIPNYQDIKTDRRHKVIFNPLVQLANASDSRSEDWPEDSV